MWKERWYRDDRHRPEPPVVNSIDDRDRCVQTCVPEMHRSRCLRSMYDRRTTDVRPASSDVRRAAPGSAHAGVIRIESAAARVSALADRRARAAFHRGGSEAICRGPDPGRAQPHRVLRNERPTVVVDDVSGLSRTVGDGGMYVDDACGEVASGAWSADDVRRERCSEQAGIGAGPLRLPEPTRGAAWITARRAEDESRGAAASPRAGRPPRPRRGSRDCASHCRAPSRPGIQQTQQTRRPQRTQRTPEIETQSQRQ